MGKFVQRSNEETLDLIREVSGSDYYNRVPDATQAGIQETMHKIFEFQPTKNQFVDTLINRIGREYVRHQSWNNMLAVFKQPMMYFGDTIEETGVGLVKARQYDPSRNYLEGDIFGQTRPDTRTAFHKINRQDYYPITVNEAILKRAFVEANGLSSFVAAVLESPLTSDQWDEYVIMTRIIREYYDLGGFWVQNVPDLSSLDIDDASDTPEAQFMLRAVRTWAKRLGFVSPHYNLAKLETFAKAEDLVLLITPEAQSALDVNALAAAFNLSYTELEQRTVVVQAQDVNIPGFQALLTTEDWFQAADTLLENTSVVNPIGLYTNYNLHHHGIYSASPMTPAILFSSVLPSSSLEIVETPVQSVTITVQDIDGNTVTSVERGLYYRWVANGVTLPAGGDNGTVRAELAVGGTSQYTWVRQSGEFSVGLDEAATTLTINGYAIDTTDPVVKAAATVNVIGARAEFPPPGVVEDADNDGLGEVTPKAPTFADNKITVPNSDKVEYKDGSTVVNGTVVTVTSGTKTITATAKAGYEIKTGATASWPFTFVA